MEQGAQLNTAIELFERLSVEVRFASLGGDGGGLVEVRGRRIVFIDVEADAATQLARCLAALASLPELENAYVPPSLREAMDKLVD